MLIWVYSKNWRIRSNQVLRLDCIRRKKLVVRFNNYDNTTNLEAKFDVPKLETYLHGVDNAGNNVFKHNYKFTQDDLSQCKNYVMKSFCTIIVQLNMAKVSMKLIASRASISFNEKVFNTHYSS